jgi:hypothetical protein
MFLSKEYVINLEYSNIIMNIDNYILLTIRWQNPRFSIKFSLLLMID